jgi:hypothetical protein
MKRISHILLLAALLVACGRAAQSAAQGENPLPTATVTPTQSVTETPTLEPAPAYPPEGYGPTGFPSDVDPLTGLQVANPALLERRPLLIKVSNLPRIVRPQWGLSLADIVFEYYTEEGSTRFAALFLGNDAEMVGPIRSARFVDAHLVRGYKAVFAFGLAYSKVLERLYNAEFANRLVIESASTPLFRYDPNGYNHLMVGTAALSDYITGLGVENGRQNLDGMSFKLEPPAGGLPATQVTVRFSGAIYNRWDYDPITGKYLRFAETADDLNNNNEQYAQSTDRLTNQPLAFDNVIVLYANYELYTTEVYDILFSGSGDGYAFRDGQAYQVRWQRNDTDVVSLLKTDGTAFSFKPGTTWFEIVGLRSTAKQTGEGWRFHHLMP